jgi:Icc-related predicted phosphoesterase
LKIFFVSDIHGSVKCFRKLVNVGKFYGADVLIMGGDLAGKQLVPIIARRSTPSAHPNPCADPAAGQQGCQVPVSKLTAGRKQ